MCVCVRAHAHDIDVKRQGLWFMVYGLWFGSVFCIDTDNHLLIAQRISQPGSSVRGALSSRGVPPARCSKPPVSGSVTSVGGLGAGAVCFSVCAESWNTSAGLGPGCDLCVCERRLGNVREEGEGMMAGDMGRTSVGKCKLKCGPAFLYQPVCCTNLLPDLDHAPRAKRNLDPEP